ncbi:MAG: 4-hydroxybenzoate octaprenyltransferase [Hyphomicrobiaceae bacterium]
MSSFRDAVLVDAAPDNWVDRWAPRIGRPYLKLMRADRPIGTWLLLIPCWWAQGLAEIATGAGMPNPWFLVLFAIGAFVMRGAGCTYNDIVDRHYDARVARTALRPIPAGLVTARQAFVFAIALSLVGFVVLIQFNLTTVIVGIGSLGLIAIYPFMKRVTHWPQAVLGLTFKWGALVGWTAVTGNLGLPMLALYVACILWTIGYDTIYAHQDKEDDAVLGLKSTALKFGAQTKPWLVGFYVAALAAMGVAVVLAGATRGPVLVGLALAALHGAWQIRTLDISDAANCLHRFRSNRDLGLIVYGAMVIEMLLGPAPA